MRKGPRRPQDVLAWLRTGPSLDELREAYPHEWQVVERELGALAAGGPDALHAYVAGLAAAPARPRGRPGAAAERALVSEQVRRVMAATALQGLSRAAAAGRTGGKLRFGLLNGFVMQRLLFERGLERKPVSLRAFRLLWPLLRQRRLLMPLVQPKGIYCFYSRPFVRGLAALVGERPALEIAAGDGTLARFLAAEGVRIVATDDYSWSRNVAYSSSVLRQDARAALRVHRPEAVICSWPPPGNAFERHVFRSESVQLYVVVNTRSEYGSGDRAAYAEQTAFELTEDERLGRLVLPPELDVVVHVFRRKAS